MMEHQPARLRRGSYCLLVSLPQEHAWMMAPDLAPVSSPVLRVGHLSRALLVYSCQAPKAEGINLLFGPVGEVGQGALEGLRAFAPTLAEEDGGRGAAIGDGLDVHGSII